MNDSFRRTFPASLEALRQLRAELESTELLLALPDELRNNALLVITEWVTNLIEHPQPPPQRVELTLLERETSRGSPSLHLEIEDDGDPFADFDKAIARRDTPLEELILDEEGLGLHLMAQLFPQPRYRPGPPNRLSLQLYPPQRRTRVAIVDDDPMLAGLMEAYLGDGYELVLYAEGMAALEGIRADPVELIISDIQMPGMDGLALRRALSSEAPLDTIPFVFLTADQRTDTEEEASELYIDDFIVKPVRKVQLQNVVRRVLTRSRQVRDRLGDRLDRSITEALRPVLPQRLGDFSCQVGTRAASAGGGDMLLHLARRDGRHLVLLADIMGHGEQAKFFAHAHAGYLNGIARALPEGLAPAPFLSQLSRGAANDPVLQATLITALALELGPDATLRCASAGHPPPLRLSERGVESVEVAGMLPGLDPEANYDEVELQLAQDELLLIYTDGLVEIGSDPASRHANEQRLITLLQERRMSALERLAEQLLEAHRILTGPTTADDTTFVLLRHEPH